MAVGIADIGDTLEKIIQPYIKDNLPKETILLDQVKRNENVEEFNDNFYAPIRKGRSYGVVNLATDKGKLRSGNSTFDQASVAVKIMTGTFDMTDLAKKGTSNKKKAVVQQLVQQATDLKNDFKRQINRQYFSEGVGVVSEVAGSVGAGTLSVQLPSASLDDGRSIDNYGTVNGDINPVKYLEVGQAIGIGTAGADVGTISSITGNTLVVTGGPAIAANDAIYLVDGDEGGAGTSEIQGLRSGISSSSGTSEYAGVARSITGWTPQIDATSEALSLKAMENLFLDAREYADTSDRYAWFMNKTPFRKYGDLLSAMRRNVNETKLLGGWSGLEFQIGANGKGGKVGVFLDYDVPDGFCFLVNLDTWTVCQVAEMNWLDDGRLLRKTDYITYQKVMSWYTNLLCVGPAANGALVRKSG